MNAAKPNLVAAVQELTGRALDALAKAGLR
jgi:hypothetical protein